MSNKFNVSKDIIINILKDYSNNFSDDYSQDTVFEYFTIDNYFKNMNLSIEEITNGLTDSTSDWGVDGIYLFVDDRLDNDWSTYSDISNNVFRKSKIDVHIFQIKNKDKIEESVPQKFQQFAYYLIGTNSDVSDVDSMNDDLKTFIRHFRKLILNVASKFPEITIHFHHVSLAERSDVSNGYKEKINATFNMLKNDTITKMDLKNDIIGSHELYTLAEKSIPKSGQLKFNANVNVPNYNDNQAGYLVTSYLKDYYEFISTPSSNGDSRILNEEMFESNIRDYQNRTSVNKSIENTLKDKSKNIDFWWLNNGITIIADEGFTASNKMQLKNVQIVNGLQTSTSIFNTFKNMSSDEMNQDNRSVFIKIIILSEIDDSRDPIIRATNSQNSVTASQLRSSDPLQSTIERFLKTKGIFYDRKKNYYRNHGKPISKIFSINYLSQAIVSILDKTPSRARSNPTILIKKDEDYKKVFNDSYDIRVFYYSLLIRMHASKYLKDLRKKSNDEVIINITKYYELHVTRVLSSLLVGTSDINESNLISLKEKDIKNVSQNILYDSVSLVKESIDNDSQDLSKKSYINDKLTEEINNYLTHKKNKKN